MGGYARHTNSEVSQGAVLELYLSVLNTPRIEGPKMDAQLTELLNEMVRRIVEVAKPLRIILFGSQAREDARPESDVDLLVVMPDGVHRRQTARQIFRALRGMGVPKDIVVATEQDLLDFAHEPSLVIAPALAEGRELYHATR
jgi:predicted nucleotidyltransferase